MEKKKKYWKNNIKEVVCISNWLRKKTLQSDLFKQFKVNFIPCTIDKSEWYPIDKKKSRERSPISLHSFEGGWHQHFWVPGREFEPVGLR